MSLRAASTDRRLQAAALLAPVLIVQAASWLLGAGPAAAPAATTEPSIRLDAILAPPRTAPPTEHQQACLAYLATLSMDQPLRSPMAHDPAPEPPKAEDTPTTDTPEPDAEPTLTVPDLRLTALLDNRTGGMAAVDGRILRPGDEAAPGWRLTRIDSTQDRILITSDDGHTAYIVLQRDLPR